MEHHKLREQVQAVQVSCHLHPALWLWNMDSAGWLPKKMDPGFGNLAPEKTPPHLLIEAQDEWLGGEQDQHLCGSIGTSIGMAASPKHPSWHLGVWATLWSAEEMLARQRQGMDIPAHARTALDGLKQKKYWKRISAESSLKSPDGPIGPGTELNGTEQQWGLHQGETQVTKSPVKV